MARRWVDDHDLGGFPAPHRQAWWVASEHDAMTVELSEPERPVPEVCDTKHTGMILSRADSILVGQSLGAVPIVRLLGKGPHLRVSQNAMGLKRL
ncbi:MAG: hypothetical protein ACK4GC_09375 [Paracoccaceae bacterium]